LHYLTVAAQGTQNTVPFGGSKFWAITFIIVGVVIFIGSFRKNERVYFALAAFMMSLWAMEYFWLSGTVSWVWIQGITWAILASIVIRVAALSDPSRIRIIKKLDKDTIEHLKLGHFDELD